MKTARLKSLLLATVLGGGAAFTASTALAQEGISIPAPAMSEPAADGSKTAVFAGGCFWGVQGVFQHVNGVKNAVSGYAGGAADTATYDMIGSGRTGHAEAVKVTYDPAEVTFKELLHVYFSVAHDPTELNRQGPDTGTQYRSTIFPENAEQAKVAAAYIKQLDEAKKFEAPIVTTIEADKPFYPAEAYHQDYLTLNPTQGYIVINDLPKIEHLKELFPKLYSDDPALVSEVTASN